MTPGGGRVTSGMGRTISHHSSEESLRGTCSHIFQQIDGLGSPLKTMTTTTGRECAGMLMWPSPSWRSQSPKT